MKVILNSLLFILLSLFVQKPRIFEVKEVPESIVYNYYRPNARYKLPHGTYRISKKEISRQVDVTNYLQAIINKYESVLLPDTKIEISKQGLKIPSNRSIYFDTNTLIVYTGIALAKLNDIIKIYDVSNVKIYNAKIQGGRQLPDQKGEWSAGICILNSTDVHIENCHIYDTWGDGIFIGSENNGVSKNITVKNIWIDKARRNAISITSAINANIFNVLLSNTHGTLPECGVDVEPSLFGEHIENVKFKNLYSYNNRNAAFNINLTSFNSDTRQYADSVKIELEDFYDQFSAGFIGLNLNNFNKKNTPSGVIRISNGVSYSEKHNVELNRKKIESNVILLYGNLKKENYKN